MDHKQQTPRATKIENPNITQPHALVANHNNNNNNNRIVALRPTKSLTGCACWPSNVVKASAAPATVFYDYCCCCWCYLYCCNNNCCIVDVRLLHFGLLMDGTAGARTAKSVTTIKWLQQWFEYNVATQQQRRQTEIYTRIGNEVAARTICTQFWHATGEASVWNLVQRTFWGKCNCCA